MFFVLGRFWVTDVGLGENTLQGLGHGNNIYCLYWSGAFGILGY